MLKIWWGEIVLAWHRATRGALLWMLLLALPGALLLLPGRNDVGLVRTAYGVALAWGILIVSALWCGGTAYALDRDRHRLTLTFTKPLHRWTLWWGRCFGVCLPFVLALCLLWILLGFRPLPEGRTILSPELPEVTDAQAAHVLEQMRALGQLPEEASEKRLLRAAREAIERRYSELSAARPLTYTFTLPSSLPEDSIGTLRLSGTPFLGDYKALNLEVQASCAGQTARAYPKHLSESGFSVDFPAGFMRSGETLTVTLLRHDTTSYSSVIFREREELKLLLPGQHPLANLTAFVVILFFTVMMAIALGTALGSTFSLPVTLFVGIVGTLAFVAAALAPELTVSEEVASGWAKFSAFISSYTRMPLREFVACNPLAALFDGEALPAKLVLKLFAFSLLPWLLLCSLLSVVTRTRDEIR